MYHYAGNNPLKFVDLDGNEISVHVQEVAFGSYHASIRIAPENQDRYKNDPRFQNIDPNTGKRYATIGAGPVSGNLVSDINRPRDIDLSIKVENNVLDLQGRNEDQVIDTLFQLDNNYGDNLDYDLFPAREGERSWYLADDGFNSNSYVSGLLEALGLKTPAIKSNVPGYDVPVPSENFNDPKK